MINNKNVSIIHDSKGKNVVLINDIRFRGKRSINWDDVDFDEKFFGKETVLPYTYESIFNIAGMEKAMTTLDTDIKTKTFRPMYLLYGQEAYLKKNYRNLLLKGLLPEGTEGSMNYTAYEGAGLDVKELIAQAETMPFFADYRVILVEDSGIFSKKGRKEDRDALAEYLASPAETCRFIFIENEAVKTYKVYKEIAEKGLVQELTAWKGDTLKRWILSRIGRSGLQITNDAYTEFCARTSTGTDASDTMTIMDNELEKLISYCADKKTIELSDVEEICSGQVNSKVFSIVDAIADRDEKRVMKIYTDLLISREAPVKIISLIEQQFLQLLKTASMVQNHVSSQEMTEALKQDWIVRKNQALLSRISAQEVRKILSRAEDYDYRIKSGKMDEQVALESLLAEAVRR